METFFSKTSRRICLISFLFRGFPEYPVLVSYTRATLKLRSCAILKASFVSFRFPMTMFTQCFGVIGLEYRDEEE